MPRRATFRVLVKWTHRRYGPQMQKATAEGTSIRRAISNALLSFFSDTNSRKNRLDAHKEITVTAWRTKTPPTG